MKNKSLHGGLLILLLFPLFLGTPSALLAAEGELLTYKQHSGALKYSLEMKTKSELETNSRSFGTNRGVTAEHEDSLTFSQRVKGNGDRLLDIALTIDDINLIPHGPSIGMQYKREQIVGNTHHTHVNLLGEVKETSGLPHFSSDNYYFRTIDGPPMDMYRVMLMLYPQFPLWRLKAGDSWDVKDKIAIPAADMPPVRGVAPMDIDLDANLSRRIKYTLLGFSKRNGYRTAHIAFEAKYGFNMDMISTYRGYYTNGSGEDKGEFWFAPKEGILVEASIKSTPVENKSMDGQTTSMWLNAKTRIFVDLVDGSKTVPLKWRSEKTISYKLAD